MVRWGERKQIQTELMPLALNEDQPELYMDGQPAESIWDASHLQATGSESALTHITSHYLPSQAAILPLLKQKASGLASDLAGSSGPLLPLSLAPNSLSSLI